MGHEWKVGDWAEPPCGSRFLVWKTDGEYAYGISSSSHWSWLLVDERVRHLPDCTGWEWDPSKPVEPTARKWEFGDWAHSPIGIVRFVCERSEAWFTCKDRMLHSFASTKQVTYLPDCTGFDWTPPSPVKQIEPPPGYRLLGRDESVADGDLFIKRSPAGNDYDWRTASVDHFGTTVGYLVDSYHIACFARKIEEPKPVEIEPRYRPFANAAEFEPFAEKWICRSEMGVVKPGAWKVIGYSDMGIYPDSSVMLYADAFDMLQFKDGTRFGVLDTKE